MVVRRILGINFEAYFEYIFCFNTKINNKMISKMAPFMGWAVGQLWAVSGLQFLEIDFEAYFCMIFYISKAALLDRQSRCSSANI